MIVFTDPGPRKINGGIIGHFNGGSCPSVSVYYPTTSRSQATIIGEAGGCTGGLFWSCSACGIGSGGSVKLTGSPLKSRQIVDCCFTQFQWFILVEKCRKQVTVS